MDLAEWYAKGRWGALLDLIDQLPTACRLNEAKMNDPELAELLAEAPAPADPWSPRISENSLTNIILAKVWDALQDQIQTQIGTAGGTPKQPKPFPTPYTAIDRFMAQQTRDWAEKELASWGFSSDYL